MDATDLPLSTKHFAGKDFALPLKKTEIKKYKDTRLKEAAARATINRQLSVLRLVVLRLLLMTSWSQLRFRKLRNYRKTTCARASSTMRHIIE